MFDNMPTITTPSREFSLEDQSLRMVFEEAADAFLNAASLLAGGPGEQLVLGIIDDLSGTVAISWRTAKALFDLLDILELRNVDDENRPEAGFFANIDPTSPVVEEICILTDQLRDAIEQAGLDHPLASRAAA